MAQFVKVRYIGEVVDGQITAMHGDPEAQENLRQICIREEQGDKYWPYVACHIKDASVDSCLGSVGVNQNKLNTCMKDSSLGLSYAQKDFDLNQKYSITGSPTLILNGKEVSEFDFGGRSSEVIKTMVACSSKTKPDFASKILNTQQAATSFSEVYADAGDQAVRNNTACGGT